jgi:hypothetical protein
MSWGWRRPVRKADNLPPYWAVVKKSGNINFLEPAGPLQACNETALPLPYCLKYNKGLKAALLGLSTAPRLV